MTAYMNRDTGETFTMAEIEQLWEQFKDEMRFNSFEDFIGTLDKLDNIFEKVED